MKKSVISTLTLAALASAPFSSAYETIPEKRENGSAAIELNLDAAPAPEIKTALTDGSKTWNSIAQRAAERWNKEILNFQFAPKNAAGTPSYEDGKSTLYFATEDPIYGESLEDSDTLAVTYLSFSDDGSNIIESDIVFNAFANWDSYRGTFNANQPDFYRVALQQLGFALGLDSADANGKKVKAIMNEGYSSTDDLAADDVLGAQALYGRSSTSSISASASTAPAPKFSVFATQNITSIGATVRVNTNPNGIEGTYYVEYGTAASGKFGSKTTAKTLPASTTVLAEALKNLTPNTEYRFRLVAAGKKSAIGTFKTALPAATGFTPKYTRPGVIVHFSGIIKPRGAAATYEFQYSKDQNFATFTSTTPVSVPVKTGDTNVAADAGNLDYSTQYYFRIKLTVGSGNVTYSPTRAFKTPVRLAEPKFSVYATQNITPSSALVRINIQPNGLKGNYVIEYGPVSSGKFASKTSSKVLPTSNQLVTENLTQLKANTEYQFRLVSGSYTSAVGKFTTKALSATAKTMTVDKNGYPVFTGTVNPRGTQVQYRFVYGPDIATAGSTARTSLKADANTEVTAKGATKVKAKTKYYYRLEVTTGTSSVASAVKTFTTP